MNTAAPVIIDLNKNRYIFILSEGEGKHFIHVKILERGEATFKEYRQHLPRTDFEDLEVKLNNRRWLRRNALKEIEKAKRNNCMSTTNVHAVSQSKETISEGTQTSSQCMQCTWNLWTSINQPEKYCPEIQEASPERPGAGPERPGAGPEKPGVGPEKPGAGPEKPGAGPEKPGAGSEKPGASPERPGASPERPGGGL